MVNGLIGIKLNSKQALAMRSFFFYQENKEHKLQFYGASRTRTVVAILLLSSQLGSVQPICVSFDGENGNTIPDVSGNTVFVSSNSTGITGGKNGTVTFPAFNGGWGIYRILCLDEGLSVKMIA